MGLILEFNSTDTPYNVSNRIQDFNPPPQLMMCKK